MLLIIQGNIRLKSYAVPLFGYINPQQISLSAFSSSYLKFFKT